MYAVKIENEMPVRIMIATRNSLMNSYSFITRLTASVARNFLQPMREPMTTVHDITIYEGYDELFGWHLGQDEMEDESSERI